MPPDFSLALLYLFSAVLYFRVLVHLYLIITLLNFGLKSLLSLSKMMEAILQKEPRYKK